MNSNRIFPLFILIVNLSFISSMSLHAMEWSYTDPEKKEEPSPQKTKRQRLDEENMVEPLTLYSDDKTSSVLSDETAAIIRKNNAFKTGNNFIIEVPTATLQTIDLFLKNIEEPYNEHL